MPTEQKKKKSKAIMPIKKEDDGHPLGHYIDDRVELIRQIFMSLKSKTIKSIAPDFLQGKSLEAIQEYCLDELLGISKKRLQSIINATKCPDDTDSSDSDVENIEEHISLEEISSDSADEVLQKAAKTKEKSKATDNKNGTAGATGSGKKEVSVLELLELQARARAIRSQLALEPVTKIELDTDNESNDSTSPKAAATSNEKSTSKAVVQETNGMQIIKPTVPAVKPVRLKRNFRQRQNSDYDPDDDDETKAAAERSETKEANRKSTDENVGGDEEKSEEKPQKQSERSPSPDLIPIIQEPETYCISSDSDEPGSVPKYINYPTVVREKLPETEDELFLKKIKEGSGGGADLRNLIKTRRGEKQPNNEESVDNVQCGSVNTNEEASSDLEHSNGQTTQAQSEDLAAKDTEPEEGELTDGDDDDLDEVNANQVTILSSDDENDETSKEIETPDKANVVTKAAVESSSDSSSSDDSSDSDSSNDPIVQEADDDDDIIDLGKDEELDFEIKEVERSEKKPRKVKKTNKRWSSEKSKSAAIIVVPEKEDKGEEQDGRGSETPEVTTEDAIKESEHDVDMTGDETKPVATTEPSNSKDDQSKEENEDAAAAAEGDTWQTRWLRGRNVKKVMATSRLASKVRTKIKQKKSKAEAETHNQDSTEVPTTEPATVVGPEVEEGSVQHYEVLIAQEIDRKKD